MLDVSQVRPDTIAPSGAERPRTSDKPMFESLKASYLEHLALKNYAPLSIRQIEQGLRLFVGWLKGRGIAEPGEVDALLFEGYKSYLSQGFITRHGKPLQVGTVIQRLYQVQGWFEWMRKKGVLMSNPIAAVRPPKHVKRLPVGVLRPDEVKALMALPELRTAIGYRDRTIMEVLYATGLRSAELTALRSPDVDLKKKAVRVRQGKGGRERFAPLSTPCCRFLDRYMHEIRPELAEGLRPAGNNWLKKAGTAEDFLFLSLYGGPVTRGGLAATMKRYLQKAGITRRIPPVHGWRHTFATMLTADGMDIRHVQTLLSHKSLQCTQIYTHVERETLLRKFKECHPRELARESVQPFIDEEQEAHAVRA